MTRFPCFLAILAMPLFHVAMPAKAEDTADKDALDRLIHAEMEKQHIPGMSVLVARAGRMVRAQGYGFSNIELQVPVKPETVFQSGSMGKQFTATAVMMLVEEGKVRLDDPDRKSVV